MTVQAPIKRQYQKAMTTQEPNDIPVMPPEAQKYVLAPEDHVEGAQELTREDMQIPQMILVQAQTKEKKVPNAKDHLGEFYNNLTGEFRKEINAIILAVAKGRVCFDRAFDSESDPLCGSDDSLMPRSDYLGAQIHDTELDLDVTIGGGPCSECPLSKFGPNSEAPMCAKSFTYGMIDAETMMPFLVSASRASSSAGKQLNTIAKQMGRKKYIKITSRYISNDKGNYYVLVFSTNGEAEPEIKRFALQYSVETGNIAQRAALTEGAPVKQLAAPEESSEPIPF